MGEALAKVKGDFGPDAVILHTRTVETKRRLPGSPRQRVEITAGKSEAAKPKKKQTRVKQIEKSPPKSPQIADDTTLADRLNALQSSVDQLLRDRWSDDNQNMPSELRQTFQSLIEAQVSADVAAQLTRKIQRELTPIQLADRDSIRNKLTQFIAAMLPIAEPPRFTRNKTPHIIALVGATGVGKTTTIAKLAANHSLRHRKTIGLITTDTLRVGAADQLQTYADIINVNLHVVSTADQMRTALNDMRHCDVVFIDTPGCSPADTCRMNDLKSLLDIAQPDETHLVLSAESNPKVIERHMHRFNHLGVNRLIFTKLDEAIGFGVILNSLKSAHARLAFTTNGQRVPDDITPCESTVLARNIISQWRVAPAFA